MAGILTIETLTVVAATAAEALKSIQEIIASGIVSIENLRIEICRSK